MSKTKGNVVDPIEIVKQYGTDAVRFTLASMASPGTDIAFNVARTEGYRAFANKIWNAARFLFMNIERAKETGIRLTRGSFTTMPDLSNISPTEDLWIISRLNRTAHDVNLALEKYRYDDAANFIYQFFWGEFCDWYLEIVKLRLDFTNTTNSINAETALATFTYVFEEFLRMLSPFMPFLTEEIWHALYDGKPPKKSIALADYPQYKDLGYLSQVTFPAAESAMQHLQRTIVALRVRRKELGVDEKLPVDAKITAGTPAAGIIKANLSVIQRLAKIGDIEIVFFSEREAGKYADLAWQSVGPIDLFVEYEKPIDVPAERERLTRDIAKYEKGIAAAERQLGNEGFLAKAPAHEVEGLKKQEAETRLLLEKARAALDALPREREES
jgi:valyl-tRNA synthetase